MSQHGLQGGADTRWASMACRGGGLTPGGPAWLAGGGGGGGGADTR